MPIRSKSLAFVAAVGIVVQPCFADTVTSPPLRIAVPNYTQNGGLPGVPSGGNQ
jgi:hypothetical protein